MKTIYLIIFFVFNYQISGLYAQKDIKLLLALEHTNKITATNGSLHVKKNTKSAKGTVTKTSCIQSGQKTYKLKGHSDHVLSAKWSHDGKRIITTSHDNKAKIWNSKSGNFLITLNSHSDIINWVSWSPSGNKILAASSDGKVKIWNAKSGKIINVLVNDSIKLNSGSYISGVSFASWSPHENKILTLSDDSEARIWDTGSGELLYKLKHKYTGIGSASWSPDGNKIITTCANCAAKVWDSETGNLLQNLEGFPNRVNSNSWSPDSKRIVVASNYGKVKIWDTESGKILHSVKVLKRHVINYTSPGDDPLYTTSWSPAGSRILTAACDSTVKIWNAESGKLLHSLYSHNDYVNLATFSPDGNNIVSASYNGLVKIWDVESGKLILNLVDRSVTQNK